LAASRPAAALAALAFVGAGLLGRALVDKLLAAQGGAVAVAAWAQLSAVAELVAGVSLAGIGTALTALAGAGPLARRLAWLKPALAVGLALSFAVALLAVPLLLWSGVTLVPGSAWLPMLALLAGWLSIAPGLVAAWLLGMGRALTATAVVCVGFAPPLAMLLLTPPAAALPGLLAGQAAFGLAVMLAATRLLRGQPPLARDALATLLRFVPAGLAIGILSPAAMVWARLEIAGNLSWHVAGQVQALWRTSDWITAVMAGLLNALYLPRLAKAAAAAPDTFRAELRRTASIVLIAAAVLLVLLWLALPAVMATLYRADIGVARHEAIFFLLGDWVRVASWVALFGLFARHAAWAITLGELLSLPLFALLLSLLAGSYGLREVGMIWCATYIAYAAFNAAALWRAMPRTR
jgi:hypothetical protein